MTFGEKVVSLFQQLGGAVFSNPITGDVWQGAEASQAYRDGLLNSQSAGKPLRLAFRNLSSVPLILCWVSENGKLHHFYKLAPSTSLLEQDLSSLFVGDSDKLETTCGGHAFCVAHVPKGEFEQIRKNKKLRDESCIIGGYRAFPECGSNNPVHLVTISRGAPSEDVACCGGVGGLRKKKRRKLADFESAEDDNDSDNNVWLVDTQIAKIDKTPWDTTKKVYELKILGGWPMYLEPNWHCGDERLENRLEFDLREATKCLPSHAVEYLRRNCPIWVNSGIKYGPKACPIRGRGACYHPDKNWLCENGLSESKHKCVEINDGPGYKKNLELWGPGGLLIHELSHAYHHRMIPDGYDNQEIIACYKAAMKEGLYECVKVHGSQGPTGKAYAATNCMEYFAELSAAFLGGKDEEEEFNKWYPFNRKQVKEHDPRAFKLLCRLWKIDSK